MTHLLGALSSSCGQGEQHIADSEASQLETLFKRGRTSKVYTCTAISIQWYLGKKIKINVKVVRNLKPLFQTIFLKNNNFKVN